jgi:hypothetical protein
MKAQLILNLLCAPMMSASILVGFSKVADTLMTPTPE